MTDVKLDLLENAIDSLNEALSKYQEGKAGNEKAFKFCVQHLSHFLELILKYYVAKSHPLLIYKNPYAKNINQESQTIGLFEAINFLKNEGLEITDKFEQDLTWLKKLRNNIEHHKFEMDAAEVEETVGRLMSAVVTFDETHENINLSDYIKTEQYDLFHKLANTYEGQLKKAKDIVKQAIVGRGKENPVEIYHCYECDHDTMIPAEDSETGYKCAFCGNEESEDIEVKCGMCGQLWHKWQMRELDWTDDGNYDFYCPRCLHDPEYVNNN